MESPVRVFPSRVGLFFVVMPILCIGGPALMALFRREWVVLIVLAFFALFVLSFCNTRYTLLTGGRLEIRSGWVYRLVISVADIQRIRPTRNPLSSPALSLDRLEIRYGKGGLVMISPKDREGFLDALLQINPAIRVEGNEAAA
jgi:hypothetical protein